MEAHELKEKIHQMRVKYLDGAASHPVDQVVCSDEKRLQSSRKNWFILKACVARSYATGRI